MNIKTLIAALVLAGSSTAALAAPARIDTDAHVDRQFIRVDPVDHCNNVTASAGSSDYVGSTGFVTNGKLALSEPTMIESGREFFNKLPLNHGYRAIELRADRGLTQISEVAIHFANGTWQTVKPNTALDAQNPSLTIRLAHPRSEVTRMVVYGSSNFGARYSVFAA